MRAVFGIGNPGLSYENTRHNLGFIILDRYADNHKLRFKPSKFDYYYAEGSVNSAEFFLIKPTTYVNNSGTAAKNFLENSQIELENFLVVTDDVNLPLGKIRIRSTGGTGGHNGIKSIIYHLESDKFPRLRFGIGSDFESGNMAEYVLTEIDEKEFEAIENSLKFSEELIENFIEGGLSAMLNRFASGKQQTELNKKEANNIGNKL